MPVGHSAIPYVSYQQKVFQPKPRVRSFNLSREKQANAIAAESKRTRLWQDLKEHWRAQEELAEELAKTHGKSVKWMKEAVLRVGKYGSTQRKVAPHNAWLHAKSLEVNATGSWRDVPEEEMAKMIRSLEAKRALVKKGIRAKPLSQMATVRQVHQRIENDLLALGQSCKTSSLCVTVHTAPHHLNEPLYAVDEIGKDFIETVLGWDMNEFCLKYESFALFRIKGIAMNGNDRAVMIRRRIRGSVVRGLWEITGNPALDMSWKNYEENIVDQYRVVLDGWPSSVFDPAKLGYKGLQTILDVLEDRSCKWCRLTDDEFTACKNNIAANGGIKKLARKERSDKGKSRGSYKGKGGRKSWKSDSSEEEESSSNED
ncbi:hypothetical protein K439DRAFT_1619194 [Ramaria rubella]|nr:hypothetical protein K439DRAFT_1619194 [Ramaria rubella]